ncbi:hypothetical protein MEO93_29015, partial [Dolichospermum sp. ST_sed3]|nr:hypothetical protein [Dolichospermum sp. ST_sed3]
KHHTENIKIKSCKSYNPENPDSDNYELPNTTQKISKSNPVNPIILKILIQTITNYQTPHRKYQNQIL